MDTQCLMCLRALIEMMVEDDEIAWYIFNMPGPSLQSARFTDWFWNYAGDMRASTMKQQQTQQSMVDFYKIRLVIIEAIFNNKDKLEAKLAPWIQDQKQKLEGMSDDVFKAYKRQSLYP